ncbi:hypothetical protein C0Q70_15522 [Pomacea canaliculata]|uniref:Uncharacterized protein n=1 Tax=Pomacea canaliculata TaxID=400727 RepID=A0A2T7NV40_POMCA|nr:hypothetical protein C0Q70_15522 [Pomacea canaliculata]
MELHELAVVRRRATTLRGRAARLTSSTLLQDLSQSRRCSRKMPRRLLQPLPPPPFHITHSQSPRNGPVGSCVHLSLTDFPPLQLRASSSLTV